MRALNYKTHMHPVRRNVFVYICLSAIQASAARCHVPKRNHSQAYVEYSSSPVIRLEYDNQFIYNKELEHA